MDTYGASGCGHHRGSSPHALHDLLSRNVSARPRVLAVRWQPEIVPAIAPILRQLVPRDAAPVLLLVLAAPPPKKLVLPLLDLAALRNVERGKSARLVDQDEHI